MTPTVNAGARYGAIMADPPWSFVVRSSKGGGRSASRHYGTMSLDDIKRMPVASCAADDCALFLWVTDPMLPHALEVLDAWGFAFKTVAFYWVKTNRGAEAINWKGNGAFVGMGYWTRANPEQCWLATRGRPKRLAADVKRVIIAPRREHSRKPDEARHGVQRLVAGPYLELFARETAVGWDAWGDEVGKLGAAA